MKKILYLQYFSHADKYRKKELDYCTKKNLTSGFFDEVHILYEKEEDINIWKKYKHNAVCINKRLSYKDVFEYSNKIDNGDIHVICNLDIFFDNTINLLFENIKNKEFYALTRWDVDLKNKTSKLFNTFGSQDTWAWKGAVKNIDGYYTLGTGGCDNAICGEFYENGYTVHNPSHKIRTHHLHAGKPRTYNDKIDKNLYCLWPSDNFKPSKIKFWKRGI